MIRRLSKKRVCMGLFGIVILVWTLGCKTVEKDAPKLPPKENALRVGVSTNAPPLIFKQNQEIVGLEADFAKEFAKYLGKSLHFVELKWEDQIPALLENRTEG